MKLREFKQLVSILFIAVFMIKMAISIAPLFSYFSNKAVTAAISQLEMEGKTDKDNTDKDSTEKDILKDKKVAFDDIVNAHVFITLLVETNVLHNQEHSLYSLPYHPLVPTPPPNA